MCGAFLPRDVASLVFTRPLLGATTLGLFPQVLCPTVRPTPPKLDFGGTPLFPPASLLPLGRGAPSPWDPPGPYYARSLSLADIVLFPQINPRFTPLNPFPRGVPHPHLGPTLFVKPPFDTFFKEGRPPPSPKTCPTQRTSGPPEWDTTSQS